LKLNLNWKILFCSLAIIGVLATSLGYIVGVSSVTMTTGIKVWEVNRGNDVYTSSTSYVNVPGMKLTIEAPIGTNLVITFTTECNINPGTSRLNVRLIVDGSAVSPKEVAFTNDGVMGTRSFTWIKHVTKGTHTIKVKWRTTVSVLCWMGVRSLVVLANSYKEFT
jgi:hypothetical protein